MPELSSSKGYSAARLTLFSALRSEENPGSESGRFAKEPDSNEYAAELLVVLSEIITDWENIDVCRVFPAKVV